MSNNGSGHANKSTYQLPQAGFTCAACKSGKCTNCSSLRCICKHADTRRVVNAK